MGLFDELGKMFSGTPEKHERVSTLLPGQERNASNLYKAGEQRGAGGAFGQSADYYRDILENDPALLEEFMRPEMRRFNQETIPDIAEQFAGMGSGGLSSSGFRNSAVSAGADLSERLGAIRANLRKNAAQGLQNIGQFGLGNFSQDVMTQQGSQGMLSQLGPAAISAGLGFLTGGPGGALAGGLSGLMGGQGGGGSVQKGSTSPYGRQQQTSGRYGLPTFGGGKF